MESLPQKPASHPQSILVRTPNWIGDQVMALGFYEGLRKSYPEAHITFLSTEVVYGMDPMGFCNEKLLLPKEARHLGSEMVAFAKTLKGKHFDLAISLVATFPAALLFFLARIPTRVGFFKDANQLFLHSGIPWKGRAGNEHKSDLYIDLLDYLTGQQHGPFRPRSRAKRENYIVVAPGASIPLREWPYFELLLGRLHSQYQQDRILVVGSANESAWHDRLKSKGLDRVEDRIEKTTLPELIEILSHAKLVVANDSGVAHLSATLAGVPTVVLYGPGDPSYIAPRGNDVMNVRIALPCSPCEKPYCRAPYGEKACLNGLSIEDVMEVVTRRIGFDT